MSDTESTTAPEGVAIIGMSGRFPKARDVHEFWRNLRDGVECISFFPVDEATAVDGVRGLLNEPGFVNAGAVLEDMDLFDASFFGFSARDAEIMDPQHRIFLECAAHCLEDAGCNPETFPEMIGVFAGESQSSYVFDLYANTDLASTLDDFQIGVGNEKDHLATQVSYRLNLRGPSLAIQTACSTSLVAVSIASQSLLNYQCDLALAGGVSADILTRGGYYYQPGGIFSPDGHCRAFDAEAAGTVAGNGVGVVLLRRLSEAIANRDNIRAVIKGFALNNDGSNKVGYTAPSVDGQAKVIAMAQAMARVEPETISYIEAHGTGTELGDPIEIAALRHAFQRRTTSKQFCAIGSVKSNIGHLDAAAGVASLIKTVLALQHKLLPPTLHFTRPNPRIDFASSPFYVNTTLSNWNRSDTPRRAGVSSFGIGGTNAHVIVEEAPRPAPSGDSRTCCALKLSARSAAALETMSDNLASYLGDHSDLALADVAYTLQVGRRTFPHRRVVVCDNMSASDAARTLRDRNPHRVFSASCESVARPVFFMFPGQGTQDVDVALGLYGTEPAFRAHIDCCAEILKPLLGLDLRDLLYPTSEQRHNAATALDRTIFTQPALFTIEYALAKLWMEWGVRPAAMIGHSIGEYTAACMAGVFSLEDAAKLIAYRGQLMGEVASGAMLAVGLSEPASRRYVNGRISLAAINGPASCVLAGSSDAVNDLSDEFSRTGIRCQRLRTSHAFHSSMMDSVIDPFVRRLQSVTLNKPQIPFQSNVTGNWITDEEATEPAYWGRQLRETVRFADGLSQMLEMPQSVFLEVGPGQTLSNLARQQPAGSPRPLVLSSLPPASGGNGNISSLVAAWGKLWLFGADGEWDRFYVHERRRRVALPGYPFERQRYWLGPPERDDIIPVADAEAAKRNVDDWFYQPCWKPSPPLPSPAGEEQDRTRHRWLVFSDETGVGSKLVALLRERGEEVATVLAGDSFVHLGPNEYSVRPQVASDHEAVVREIISNGVPDMIIHLWGVTSPSEGTTDDQAFDECQERGFYSIVRLVQALEKEHAAGGIRMTVVSSQTQTVTGTEQLCPAKATVLALCKVIPQEHARLRCQSVDIDLCTTSDDVVAVLARNLLTELVTARFEAVVAWRKGRRWIQAFEQVRLPAEDEQNAMLRRGGVYLITGGLGKIGLVLVGYLARTVQAKLILTSRSDFPARREWRQYLRKDPGTITAGRIRSLMEIETLGAEILIMKADVADHEQMARVLAEAERRFGQIHGVIHGAGNTETLSSVAETGTEAAAQQFGPKAAGLMVLDALLRGKDLDFVLLLSSLSTILGGPGLGPYAAANMFLDAFAVQRSREDFVPWISVNWDSWAFPTEVETESERADSILPDEGEQAFARILNRAPRQIIVSVSDLDQRLDEWVRMKTAEDSRELAGDGLKPQHSRPNLPVPYTAAMSETEATLVEIWQQLLGVSPIGILDNFFDLGGHSLLAIQLTSRIRAAFGAEVPVHRTFETPTIAELADFIAHHLGAVIDTRTAELVDLVEQLSDTEIEAMLEQTEGSGTAGTISHA